MSNQNSQFQLCRFVIFFKKLEAYHGYLVSFTGSIRLVHPTWFVAFHPAVHLGQGVLLVDDDNVIRVQDFRVLGDEIFKVGNGRSEGRRRLNRVPFSLEKGCILFLKMGNHGLFFIYFHLFKRTLQILQQICM